MFSLYKDLLDLLNLLLIIAVVAIWGALVLAIGALIG
jgi:hypothetical protein